MSLHKYVPLSWIYYYDFQIMPDSFNFPTRKSIIVTSCSVLVSESSSQFVVVISSTFLFPWFKFTDTINLKFTRCRLLTWLRLSIMSTFFRIFVLTKFHFDGLLVLPGWCRPSSPIFGKFAIMQLCKFGATVLRFGTVFTKIILLWIRNFANNGTTLTPLKTT